MPDRYSLDDEPFSHHATKDGRIRISYRGRVVTTLTGADAQKFTARIGTADMREAQLVMAKATKNFKRGNERQSK